MVEKLQKQLEQKGKELNEYRTKHNILIQGEGGVASRVGGPEGGGGGGGEKGGKGGGGGRSQGVLVS